MSSLNKNLAQAKRNKNDEFYTQLSDIEKELYHYRDHFKGKVVYCNCDDPMESSFFEYFAMSFKFLGLKKLITSCYRSDNPAVRTSGVSDTGVWLEYNGELDGTVSIEEIRAKVTVHNFKGDGDFRSEESINLLKEADIVVTNPPFSLFREYVAQLMEYGKKFIVLGNMNATTYKEIFPLFKNNEIWYGPSISSGDREFQVPESYPLTAASSRVDDEGNKFVRVKGVRWFTNLDHSKRHEDIILFRKYNEQNYPNYDNYKAINVDKVADIPKDYDGVMGVPITFLDKYNPNQFEIIDANDIRINDSVRVKPHGLIKDIEGSIGERIVYARILIKKKGVN